MPSLIASRLPTAITARSITAAHWLGLAVFVYVSVVAAAWGVSSGVFSTRKPAAPTSPLPRAASQAPAVAAAKMPAEAATDVMTGVYAQFDAELGNSTVFPSWAWYRNFRAEVARADPSASVVGIACTDDFCRVDIHRERNAPVVPLDQQFNESLHNGGTVLFRYVGRDMSRMFMYVMNNFQPYSEPLALAPR